MGMSSDTYGNGGFGSWGRLGRESFSTFFRTRGIAIPCVQVPAISVPAAFSAALERAVRPRSANLRTPSANVTLLSGRP